MLLTTLLAADLVTGIQAYMGKDYRTASKELFPLAEKGVPRAQFLVGRMIFHGQFYKPDGNLLISVAELPNRKRGVEFLKAAALAGDEMAASELGWLYRTGPHTPWYADVPTNLGESLKWLRLAVAGDDAFGEFVLAQMYKDGEGVPKDYAEAARLFRLAAEQGYADAQNQLGSLYLEGRGVIKDHVQAYVWLNLASAPTEGERRMYPPKWAAEMRDALEKVLTPDQIVEAQARSQNFTPRNRKVQ